MAQNSNTNLIGAIACWVLGGIVASQGGILFIIGIGILIAGFFVLKGGDL